jgi:hypothetical protein
VAVHGEEETVVQLMKQVRMLPSTTTPVSDVVLIGGDGGLSLAPLISEKPQIRGRPPLTTGPVVIVVLEALRGIPG